MSRRESSESRDRGAGYYECHHFADAPVRGSLSSERVSLRADAAG